jgi:hypothetical protein
MLLLLSFLDSSTSGLEPDIIRSAGIATTIRVPFIKVLALTDDLYVSLFPQHNPQTHLALYMQPLRNNRRSSLVYKYVHSSPSPSPSIALYIPTRNTYSYKVVEPGLGIISDG